MKRLLMLVVLSFSATAFAVDADFGLEVGFRQQSGSTDSVGVTAKSQTGFTLGLSAFVPLQGALGLRTGLQYSQRPLVIEVDGGGGDMKLNLSYFDVPVALAFKFTDAAYVFGGVELAMNLENSVTASGSMSGQKLTDTKSMVLPVVIGANFKFASQLGATVYFETIPGEIAKDLNGYRAVGANLMFTY